MLAAGIAAAAYRARALTRSGAAGAVVVGTSVFGAGGWPYAAVLFAFFLPSTLLSRLGRRRKAAFVDVGKHGSRDAAQVLANGGVAALCALAAALLNAPALAAAFAGACAAACADTWGTEIGTLSPEMPRSIRTLRRIPAGLSGGVTMLGTAAEVAGAALVALVAAQSRVAPFVAVAAGGMAGSLADSLLGAWVQERRYCPVCKRECETNPHVCGAATAAVRGVRWLTNDAVNALATITGALAAGCVRTFFPNME